jgi:predicted RNA polymerase sigma factor
MTGSSAQMTWAVPVEAAIDWRQIVLLYDLLRMSPSPVVRLNRAAAQDLEHSHLFHSIRELLLGLSEREQARASALRALGLSVRS